MKVLPYFFVSVMVVVAVIFCGIWLGQLTRKVVAARENRQYNKAKEETAWTSYSRPDGTGWWHIGVERYSPINGGTTFGQIELQTLAPDVDDFERFEAETKATIQANRYNQNL